MFANVWDCLLNSKSNIAILFAYIKIHMRTSKLFRMATARSLEQLKKIVRIGVVIFAGEVCNWYANRWGEIPLFVADGLAKRCWLDRTYIYKWNILQETNSSRRTSLICWNVDLRRRFGWMSMNIVLWLKSLLILGQTKGKWVEERENSNVWFAD